MNRKTEIATIERMQQALRNSIEQAKDLARAADKLIKTTNVLKDRQRE